MDYDIYHCLNCYWRLNVSPNNQLYCIVLENVNVFTKQTITRNRTENSNFGVICNYFAKFTCSVDCSFICV